MTAFAPPVVAWQGEQGGGRPLVVLLHGCGSDEADIVALADHLPDNLVVSNARRFEVRTDGGRRSV